MTSDSNPNPYAPPASKVDDVTASDPRDRPRSVIYAVRLLWIAFGLGVIGSAFDLFVTNPEPLDGGTVGVSVFMLLVSFGISYWLFGAAWRGRSWSRIVQAVLLVLGFGFLYLAWSFMPSELGLPLFAKLEMAVTAVMNIVGTVMLFSPSANAWYRAMRA